MGRARTSKDPEIQTQATGQSEIHVFVASGLCDIGILQKLGLLVPELNTHKRAPTVREIKKGSHGRKNNRGIATV